MERHMFFDEKTQHCKYTQLIAKSNTIPIGSPLGVLGKWEFEKIILKYNWMKNLIKNVQLKRGQGTDFSLLECRTYYNTIVIKKYGD